MLEGQAATYKIRCFEKKKQLDLVADIATTAQVSDPTFPSQRDRGLLD